MTDLIGRLSIRWARVRPQSKTRRTCVLSTHAAYCFVCVFRVRAEFLRRHSARYRCDSAPSMYSTIHYSIVIQTIAGFLRWRHTCGWGGNAQQNSQRDYRLNAVSNANAVDRLQCGCRWWWYHLCLRMWRLAFHRIVNDLNSSIRSGMTRNGHNAMGQLIRIRAMVIVMMGWHFCGAGNFRSEYIGPFSNAIYRIWMRSLITVDVRLNHRTFLFSMLLLWRVPLVNRQKPHLGADGFDDWICCIH